MKYHFNFSFSRAQCPLHNYLQKSNGAREALFFCSDATCNNAVTFKRYARSEFFQSLGRGCNAVTPVTPISSYAYACTRARVFAYIRIFICYMCYNVTYIIKHKGFPCFRGVTLSVTPCNNILLGGYSK